MNPLPHVYPSMYHLLMAAYLAQDDGEEDWVDVEMRENEEAR